MRNIIFTIIVLFFNFTIFVILANSESLSPTPIWLNPGKSLKNQAHDERFYFIKFKEKMLHENEYMIALLVYSYSPSLLEWTVWEYEPQEKNFKPIDTKKCRLKDVLNLNHYYENRKNRNSIDNRTYGNHDIDKMYKIFIRSNSPMNGSFFNDIDKNILIFPKNFHKKKYFTKDELSALRLIHYNPKTKEFSFMKDAEQFVFFDTNGYGVFRFTPKISNEKDKTKTVILEEKKDDRVKVKEAYLPLLPDDKINRDGKLYTYFSSFGYVNLNENCYHYGNIFPNQEYIVTTIIDNYIIYSPIKADVEFFKFYNPPYNNSMHYLWQKSGLKLQPLGKINNTGYFEFRQNRNDNINNISNYTQSVIEKWRLAIKAYENAPTNEKEKIRQYLCKSNPTLLKFFEQFINFQKYHNNNLSFSKKPLLSFQTKHIYLTKNSFFQKTNNKWALVNTSKSESKYIEIPSWKNLFRTFELKINDKGDKALYCRTLLYDTLFSNNREYQYQKLKLFEQEKELKIWIIIDDYVDPERSLAKRLYEFKKSHRLYNILFNNDISRIDIIKGSNIIKKSIDDTSICDSIDTRFSEIVALTKLENHLRKYTNDNWQLHLFLARKTSGIRKNAASLIAYTLKKMHVQRIVLWEFCDYEPTEKTIYNNLFKQISEDNNIDYTYKPISSKNNFYTIKVKGY